MPAPWTFFRYLPLASRVIAKGRLPAVLIAVARKRSSKGGLLKGLREDLSLLQALCLAWWRGEYRSVSRPALIAAVAGLLYFLSPMDAIPDWLPGLGFVDDLAVLGWVMRKWSGELEAFKAWRARQPASVRESLAHMPDTNESLNDEYVSPGKGR